MTANTMLRVDNVDPVAGKGRLEKSVGAAMMIILSCITFSYMATLYVKAAWLSR